MTINQASNQIRKLLDALPQKKNNKERLSLAIHVKALVEIIQQKFENQRLKEEALAAQRQIIKKALKQLLVALDRIFEKHEELGDSGVRDKMYEAIQNSFIKPQSGYTLPKRFGMFSEQGDRLVHSAVQKFLAHPEVIAARTILKTPDVRLNAFQDYGVETKEGTNCFEYFGYRNKPAA